MPAPSGRRFKTTFHTSPHPLTCAGCRTTIPAGSRHVLGLTREPYHPDCKRRQVVPTGEESPRYLVGDPVGKTCVGCDHLIDADDLVVHIMAKPWHKECRRWA